MQEDYKLIADLWKFMKSKLPVRPGDEEYWYPIHDDVVQFARDHGSSQFAKDLICAVYDELCRRKMEIEKT